MTLACHGFISVDGSLTAHGPPESGEADVEDCLTDIVRTRAR